VPHHVCSEGNTVKVTFSSANKVVSVEPTAPAPASYAQMSTVLGHYGPIKGSGNATIYFVDAVILTESTYTTYIKGMCMQSF